MRQRDSPFVSFPFQQIATGSAQLESQGASANLTGKSPLNQKAKVLTHGLSPHAHEPLGVVQPNIREGCKQVVLDE